MSRYDYASVEAKWQKYWEEHETFKTDVWDFSKPKFYALDMFPYPSGVGLHAGHPEGYTATDIVSRMKYVSITEAWGSLRGMSDTEAAASAGADAVAAASEWAEEGAAVVTQAAQPAYDAVAAASEQVADAAGAAVPAGTEAVNVRITWFVKRSITDTVFERALAT